MYLTEFLEKYNPRGALIEIPSTSLFELLGLDIEIFLMNNYLCPFEKQALEKLKKRVHYSEDINEIIKNLDFFLKGKLVEKRDQTFYNHYVYKKNTKENIVQLVDSLIGNQEVK